MASSLRLRVGFGLEVCVDSTFKYLLLEEILEAFQNWHLKIRFEPVELIEGVNRNVYMSSMEHCTLPV